MSTSTAEAKQALLDAIKSKADRIGSTDKPDHSAGSEIHSLAGAFQALSATEQ